MALPRGTDYDQAVQNPQLSFTDPQLRASRVETNPLGLPKPYSGGFTTTFRMQSSQGDWAVRCFTREIHELQRRYQAISQFLSRGQSKYFVSAQYLGGGIRINGKEFPIIKMQWLSGEPLNIFLEKNYVNRRTVETLLSDFEALVNELQRFGIAHGDLQHGNIIVMNNQLYLIDYDGMFLPELGGLPTSEIGHINYQHPQRAPRHYNKDIDRFATLIIYLGLKAISINPGLWTRYNDGENILFKNSDFADLRNSALISDLGKLPELRELVRRFIGVCYLEFDKIPSLSEFISGNFAFPPIQLAQLEKIEIRRSQYLVLDGTLKGTILEHAGERVEIVGKITALRLGTTRFGAPYSLLNMGGSYPNHTFTIVIWAETINALKIFGITPSDYKDKWVSVTGVISQFKGRPQLYIEQTAQIKLLTGLEEAQRRLVQKHYSASKTTDTPTKPTAVPKTGLDSEGRFWEELYRNRQPSSPRAAKPKTTAPKLNIPQTSRYKPVQTPAPSQSANTKKNGCLPYVIGGIIFGAIGAGLSEEPWGLLFGVFVGFYVGSLFAR